MSVKHGKETYVMQGPPAMACLPRKVSMSKPDPTPGAIAVFTDEKHTIVNVNDGGIEIECRLSPRAAFRVARQIFSSAVRTATRSAVHYVARGSRHDR